MKKKPEKLSDMDEVRQLRINELSKMFSPHFSSLRNYQVFIMHLVIFLGDHKPVDDRDRTIRNLVADCYDMIDPIASNLKEGKYNVASTLTRRLYEDTSLVNAFILNVDLHNRWHSGEEIQNREVREELDKSKLGADIESTKHLYGLLSDLSHPSRVAIMDRFLGEGVDFTLGGYLTPSVYHIAEALVQSVSMMFWLCATVALFYKPLITKHNPELMELYKFAAEHAQKVNGQLHKELDRLLTEENITFIEKKYPLRKKRRKKATH
ncbi:hypothetical protein C3433_10725 [Citrobacter freundii]|nr:hypothetical protein C3433_10725 [Citrobacter freundii]